MSEMPTRGFLCRFPSLPTLHVILLTRLYHFSATHGNTRSRRSEIQKLQTLEMAGIGNPYARFYHEDLKVERDVEEQLLEPLLRKIGYTKWVRQLPLRMGRGDRVFPDYALGVTGRGDDAAAEYIWEAKYRIPTAKQLKIDFGQAKSYALRLQSKALGLISIEGVWFVTAEEGFRFERLRHFSWEQLVSPDALAELKRAFCKVKSDAK